MAQIKLESYVGKGLFLIALTAILFSPQATSALPIVLNDGGTHNIDYDLGNVVSIHDNINSPYDSTKVNFLSDSGFLGFFANDHSVVNVHGNSSGNFYFSAYDSSAVTLNNGFYDVYGHAYDDSRIIMHGGAMDSFETTGEYFYMDGGTIINSYLSAEKSIINNGYISTTLSTGGYLKILNGDINPGDFLVGGDVDIFGGQISGGTIISGNLHLYGKSFNIPFGTYTASDNLDYVSGALQDGSVDLFVGQSPHLIVGTGTLTLHQVPEPATAMLVFGQLIIGACLCRRRTKKRIL